MYEQVIYLPFSFEPIGKYFYHDNRQRSIQGQLPEYTKGKNVEAKRVGTRMIFSVPIFGLIYC